MRIAYRPDIDGLRAVAVLSVLGFHAFPSVFPGGFIGVDVFFVISGFLITSILFAEMHDGVFSLTSFYARRILRIFPALFLVLLACLLTGWYTLLADEYKQLGKHIAAGAGFVSNMALWFEAGYFDRASEFKPLLHLWSLGIEEQFYIVWPLLLWGLWRLQRGVRGATLGMLVLSLLYAAVLVFIDRTQTFYAPWTRAWELLAGALLALQWQQTGTLPAWMQRPTMQWGALLALLVGVFLLRPEYPFPGALALIPVAAATVLIAGPRPGAGPVAGLLGSRPMVAVGLISYPLYLWHWPLLSFAHIMASGQPPVSVRLGLLLASLVLATLTYWVVEKPLRRLPRRWVIGILVVALSVVGLLGMNIYKRDGLERIRHRQMIQMDAQLSRDFLDFEPAGLITDAKCAKPFKFPERDVCLVQDPSKPVTAVVLGDSHAVHSFWGLAEAFGRQGLNLAVRGKGACMPLKASAAGSGMSECERHMEATLSDLAADPQVRAVALVFRGRYLGAQSSPQERQDFESRLSATLALLQSAGKQVYYFLPVVEPDFDPRLCVGSLPLGRKPPRPCDISRQEDDGKTAVLRGLVEHVLKDFPGVHLVDPNVAICQDSYCPIVQQGHSIFKDDNHVSHFGSMLIGNGLDQQLRR